LAWLLILWITACSRHIWAKTACCIINHDRSRIKSNNHINLITHYHEKDNLYIISINNGHNATGIGTNKKEKSTAAVATKRASVVSNDYYKTALGLKFLYGISFTVKHFINDKAALEAVIQYRSHSGVGKEFNFTGLYEYHGEIKGASGLRWYAGGGAYVGYFSYDNDQLEELVDESSTTTFGVAGTVGLEYKIKSLPIAISADWQPVYILNGNSGFAADNGGFGIKYTF
jgi:hypothetical protein